MTTKVLELTCDVANPQADRRSKDWNKVPVLTKGQRFTWHEGRDYDWLRSANTRAGQAHHYSVTEPVLQRDGNLGQLIVNNSTIVEPKTYIEMKRVYDCDYDGLAEVLFDLGRIGPDDFKALSEYFNEERNEAD